MKALAKERDRRYETANGFALDIERHLNQEPVEAGPPSATYRVRKFVRRNRGKVVAAALLLLTLVGGIVGTTWGMFRANHFAHAERTAKDNEAAQRVLAETNESKAKEATAAAEGRLREVSRITRLMAATYKDLDPTAETRGGQPLRVQLGERLAANAKQIDEASLGDARMALDLRRAFSRALYVLGYHGGAAEQAAVAYQLALDKFGPVEALDAGDDWIAALIEVDPEGAIRECHQILERAEAAIGPHRPETRTIRNDLAQVYQTAGKHEKGCAIRADMLAEVRAAVGADHPDTLVAARQLALGYTMAGKGEEARRILEPIVAALPPVGTGRATKEEVELLRAMYAAYVAEQNFAAAEKTMRRTLADCQILYGDKHVETGRCLGLLSAVVYYQGRHKEAFELTDREIATKTSALGPLHPEVFGAMANQARGQLRYGDHALGVRFARQVLDGYRKSGIDDSATPDLALLANRLKLEKEPALAEEIFAAVQPLLERNPSREGDRGTGLARTTDLGKVIFGRVECLRTLGKDDDAAALITRWEEKFGEASGRNPYTLALRIDLAEQQIQLKKTAAAEHMLTGAYAAMQKNFAQLPPAMKKALPGMVLDKLIRLATEGNKPEDVKKWQVERAKYK